MQKIKLSIGNRIFGGFLILIVLFVANAAIIFYTGNKIDQVANRNSEVVKPSEEAINEFILMVTQSKMWITNWVYLPSNSRDKEALQNQQKFDYPELKDKLEKLMSNWEVDSQKVEMQDSVIARFEQMMEYEKEIMDQLVTFENYEDPITKLLAEDAIDSQIIPIAEKIQSSLDEVALIQADIVEEANDELITAANQLRNITIILGVILVVIGLLSAYFITRSITKPINYIKDIIVKLGNGELVDDKGRKFNNDEIGEMAAAMDNLISGLRSTTLFAENIGKGNYESEYKPLSDDDVLGNALLDMRSNLARVAEEDKKRNWSTEGLAKFGDILRKNNDNIDRLSDDIIRNLVQYMGANQGGLYIIDDTEDEPFMTLTACYAWDKKKYVDQKIYRGEGLAGQVWQEMDTVYLTDVPDNYVKITSGLGDANPKSILIVPLKVNEEIYGVVEIASFKNFDEYEIEFVEKIAESIASTVSSVKINATTQRLLEESQEMTEQMRSQEEEMRQNMEELQATQEEMQRGQNEAQNTMNAINSGVAIIEFDPTGIITNANENFLYMMGYDRSDIMGEHHRIFVPHHLRNTDEYKKMWSELASGIAKKGEYERVTKSGQTIYLYSQYAIVRNQSGEVSKIMNFAVDISKYKD